MKYALLEQKTNKILGWYADDIHSSIPINCIEVEDETWQEALKINANCYENRKFIFKDFRTEKEIYQATIPTKITMRQCRLYLLSKDLLDDVETLVSTNKAWQIEWEYANEVLRTNQLIPAMQSTLNLTNEQIDTMFLEASKL